MFQYVNITHSDTDPGLDPADITTTPPAHPFPVHPNTDSHPQTQVPYHVHQSLDLPLVNSDSNHPPNKLESQPIHNPVNTIFPNHDPHTLPTHHRSIDHVINQPQTSLSLNHPTLSPHHQDHLTSHQEPESHLPHFSRPEKSPIHLHPVSLPLALRPPQRPSQPLSHSQSHSTNSWAIPFPGAPTLPTQQPPNPISRIRPQLPSDQLYYPSAPFPNPSPTHVQPPPPPTDNYRHISTMRTHRPTPSAHREIDQHRSPRKRQKRSLVWQFFKESDTDPNVANCLICKQRIPRGRNLARNTTNLRKHLEHRHPGYITNQNLTSQQHARRNNPPHLPVAPPPSSTIPHHNIDDITSGMRPLFQPGSTSHHRPPPDDRIISMQPHHQQPPPQIPISQDRSALSLSPAAPVYHGATHEAKNDSQFRQAHSLDESSSLVPPPIKRATPAAHPIQMNQIPVSNLYNTQPQGNTQAHPPDLTESGPNSRGKDPPSWDPKSLRPPKGFFREGDDGEEAMSNGDRQIATQEASAALIKFLAAAGLPLATAKSKQLIELLDVINSRMIFPNTLELRDHVLPSQVTLLHSKIRSALSTADVIVATIEKKEKNRLIFCHYFAENFSLRSVCLDVIHPAEVREGFHLGVKPPSTENSAFLQSKAERMAAENSKRVTKLLQRVSNNLDYWKITHKVNAVIVAEKGITADNSQFLPEPSNSGSPPSLAFKEPPDTSSKSSRRLPLSSEKVPSQTYDQCAETGPSSHSQTKIPVLSCLISTIERIITETICQSDLIARCFIEPLSRGIFKALTDRKFLLTKASDAWSEDFKLPVCNPSPWELKKLLSFYNSHMETVQHAVKRVDPKDLEFQCIIKRDVTFLHSLLETFASCVKNIEPTDRKGNASKRERTSTALPVFRNLLKSLENLYARVGDSLRVVVSDVLRAVRFQANTMEKEALYACATLLDPRFKSRYLSKDVLDSLKNNVMVACGEEIKGGGTEKTDGSMGTQSGSNFNTFAHYMESIASDHSVIPSALSSYLSEPTSGYNEDIDDYWHQNQGRWPFLARVAARYIVTPCSCGSNRISKVLLGSGCRRDADWDFSRKDIQAMSAMELLRMNAV